MRDSCYRTSSATRSIIRLTTSLCFASTMRTKCQLITVLIPVCLITGEVDDLLVVFGHSDFPFPFLPVCILWASFYLTGLRISSSSPDAHLRAFLLKGHNFCLPLQKTPLPALSPSMCFQFPSQPPQGFSAYTKCQLSLLDRFSRGAKPLIVLYTARGWHGGVCQQRPNQ